MSWLNTLSFWQWAVLACVPPAIILLYFLKLKRHPLEVPSTYLWSRTIEDLHVNSIWQRLRQNLLLLLQLALIALIILALLRPGLQGSALTGNRFIFLVDTSASMNATDTTESRLQVAKNRLKEYIEQMSAGDAAMIIAFADNARIIQTYTTNRNDLLAKVDSISPTNRPTDLREALQAAAGLANPGITRGEGAEQGQDALQATLYILSDGGFPDVPEFFTGNLIPIPVRIGTENPSNVAIAAFSADRNPDKPGKLQIFARMENHALEPATVDLELYLDDRLVDASRLEIEADGSQSASFELPDIEEGVLKLAVKPDDALASDNTAYLAINRAQAARVLVVSPGNEYLELALNTDEAAKYAEIAFESRAYMGTKEYQDRAALGVYDLVIYDRCVPEQMPQANTLFFGQKPPVETWKTVSAEGVPAIIDVERTHPLMQYVVLENVGIAQGFSLEGPEGSKTLIESVMGPLLVIAPRQGFEDAALGFGLFVTGSEGREEYNTNWPLRPSFPVFVMNVIRYLGNASGITAGENTSPGRPMVLRSDHPVATIRVVSPENAKREIVREGQNVFMYPNTEALGVYQVYEGSGDKAARRFTVNLYDSRESQLTPRDLIEIGHKEIKAVTGSLPARHEFWRWLVLIGLGLLIFEWYVYNRRVYL